MPQDRDTGAAANEYGRATARSIAMKIGATEIKRSSNECRLDGQKIVIKCARLVRRVSGSLTECSTVLRVF